ncbi:hypothetical protein V9T40_013256 [Parthenolecanium corni]|uniref:Uncharacterized protein n=1 Tax=Parthenolecanium corni TaxID=536013 RepID=A0AAN9TL05_9HEMI
MRYVDRSAPLPPSNATGTTTSATYHPGFVVHVIITRLLEGECGGGALCDTKRSQPRSQASIKQLLMSSPFDTSKYAKDENYEEAS